MLLAYGCWMNHERRNTRAFQARRHDPINALSSPSNIQSTTASGTQMSISQTPHPVPAPEPRLCQHAHKAKLFHEGRRYAKDVSFSHVRRGGTRPWPCRLRPGGHGCGGMCPGGGLVGVAACSGATRDVRGIFGPSDTRVGLRRYAAEMARGRESKKKKAHIASTKRRSRTQLSVFRKFTSSILLPA